MAKSPFGATLKCGIAVSLASIHIPKYGMHCPDVMCSHAINPLKHGFPTVNPVLVVNSNYSELMCRSRMLRRNTLLSMHSNLFSSSLSKKLSSSPKSSSLKIASSSNLLLAVSSSASLFRSAFFMFLPIFHRAMHQCVISLN